MEHTKHRKRHKLKIVRTLHNERAYVAGARSYYFSRLHFCHSVYAPSDAARVDNGAGGGHERAAAERFSVSDEEALGAVGQRHTASDHDEGALKEAPQSDRRDTDLHHTSP